MLPAILDSVGEGLTVLDRDGRFVYANDVAARACGFESAAELMHATLDEVGARFEVREEHGAVVEREQTPTERALRGEESPEVLVRSRQLDDSEERWYLISARPVRDAQGRVAFATTVFRDITERQRAQDAIRYLADASEALASSLDYEATLATVAHLAVPRLADWCAVEIEDQGKPENRQLAVAHVDPAKVEFARELRRRYPPDPASPYGPAAVMRTGRAQLLPVVDEELLLSIARDDQHRHLLRQLELRSGMVVPLVSKGMPIGAITFVAAESGRIYSDADLLFAEELARRASVAVEKALLYREARDMVTSRDTFLSVASHELKTPVTSLQLQLESLRRRLTRGDIDEERALTKVDSAIRQTYRATELIEMLLDVSKLTSGHLELRKEQMDLSAALRDIVERFGHHRARHAPPIRLHAPDSVVGRWDRLRIEQIVVNLLDNAAKYAPGEPIDVELTEQDDQVCLVVSDRGIGIAPEDQARIFDRFERAVSARQYGGFGMGLWIVRQLAEMHGGGVEVRSERAQGSTFVVTLPREPTTRA